MNSPENAPAELQLSVVVPVYNEAGTVAQVVGTLSEVFPGNSFEILLVDDGSNDGTAEVIRGLENGQVRTLFHSKNQGKGAALRTAFGEVRGGIVVVQDADLEYHPHDIPRLIQPILDDKADVVYGTRFLEGPRRRFSWHRAGNGLLTWGSNLLTRLKLSDMECGYKAFRVEVLTGIQIRENRFGVEPELTAKVAREGWRVVEVPISYARRDYASGKKIKLRDAFRALWCIVRYRFWD